MTWVTIAAVVIAAVVISNSPIGELETLADLVDAGELGSEAGRPGAGPMADITAAAIGELEALADLVDAGELGSEVGRVRPMASPPWRSVSSRPSPTWSMPASSAPRPAGCWPDGRHHLRDVGGGGRVLDLRPTSTRDPRCRACAAAESTQCTHAGEPCAHDRAPP